MKFFTKFATIIIAFVLVFVMFSVPTSAAKNATLYFSSNQVKVGDKVTVSVTML